MEWQANWLVDEDFRRKAGGQGTVRRVIHKETRTVGALKEMHPESIQISERRERMAREVKILANMSWGGVPRLFESNIHSVDDKTIPLYFICDWIQGTTLQEFAGGAPRDLSDALSITRNLADILMHCHNSGIQHRDIKPDNILLNENRNQITLVDFGIAYSTEFDETSRTLVRQELGNRFLRLPELGAGGTKRDIRSDVTQAVGILFFLLTGRSPNALIDEQNRPPHKRPEIAIFKPEAVNNVSWKRVLSIFDVGFSLPTTLRFPDASSLVRVLDEAISYVPDPARLEPAFLKEVDAFNAAREQVNIAIKTVEASLIDAVNTLATEIMLLARMHEFSYPHPHARMVKTGREAKMLWAISHERSEEPRVFIGLFATLEGDDSNKISVRLMAESHEEVTEPTFVLYEGAAADTSRLLEEIHKRAGDALSVAVRWLTQKIQSQSL